MKSHMKIFFVGYVTPKKSLYLFINKINRYIDKSHENKYLTLALAAEERLKKYQELWDKTKDLFTSTSNNSDGCKKKYIIIKFNFDCIICYCWNFLERNFRFYSKVCDGCHDLMQKAINFDDIENVFVKGIVRSFHQKNRKQIFFVIAIYQA